MSDTFDAFIMAVIALNTVCLGLVYVDMPLWFEATLSWLNFSFTVVFCIEAVAKITALGPRSYFTDRWCIFDFVVAALALGQLALDQVSTDEIPGISALRIVRIVRIFRLIPKVCLFAVQRWCFAGIQDMSMALACD